MLIGEYQHNIDSKGRVIIPVKFRENLGNSFVASKDSDRCIRVYSKAEWEAFSAELSAKRGAAAKILKRKVFSEAAPCELDSQGKALIPANLREHADIKKEVVIIGVDTHIEIWDKDRWAEVSSGKTVVPPEVEDEVKKMMEDLGI